MREAASVIPTADKLIGLSICVGKSRNRIGPMCEFAYVDVQWDYGDNWMF